jgi:acyl-CoA dehydrogenase
VTLDADGTLTGRVRGVPFAQDAEYLAVLATGEAGASIALVDTTSCRIEEGHTLAGDALNVVGLERAEPLRVAPAPAGFDLSALLLMGAVARSVETAGALETVLALCLRYANERVAFGRPIGKFQAIQHSLARLAGEAAAAISASGSAADAIASCTSFQAPVFSLEAAVLLEAAAAKIRCAEAAEEAAAIAHQVHGAIGFTNEHVLHRFTLRLLSWREDFGNESYWALRLGNTVAAQGAADFWPLVAAR